MARWRRDSTVNKVTRDGSGESAETRLTLISDGLWSGLWVKGGIKEPENEFRCENLKGEEERPNTEHKKER